MLWIAAGLAWWTVLERGLPHLGRVFPAARLALAPMLGICVVLVVAVSVGRDEAPVCALIALLAVPGYAYVVRLLRIPRGQLAIGLGDALPDFTLRDVQSRTIGRADVLARAPALLILYRGAW